MVYEYDPSSFRDPSGRVFYQNGEVFRELSEESWPFFEELFENGTIKELVKNGQLVESTSLADSPQEFMQTSASKTVIWHKKIDWVTYPYEWPFSMLKKAALLTLDLLEFLTRKELTLKDASPYNVLFEGIEPVFIDLTSIQPLHRPFWQGYSQFCEGFLFPLMLSAHLEIPHCVAYSQSLAGLKLRDARRLFGIRSFLRPGVFRHVLLQAYFEKRFSKEDVISIRHETNGLINKNFINATVTNLTQTVHALKAPFADGVWMDYVENNSYSKEAQAEKRVLVENWLRHKNFMSLVDIGCNTGIFSKIAAKYVQRVLAIDEDHDCIEELYQSLQNTNINNIHPVVINFLEPSPARGWSNSERRSFTDRIQASAFLALALIHHIVIAGDIPLCNFAKVLKNIAPCGIVEWIERDDPMVQAMMAGRDKSFGTYTYGHFLAAFDPHFNIAEQIDTNNPHRKLIVLNGSP